MRLVTAYFPHSGYNDQHIQRMYDTLNSIVRQARKSKSHIIIGANCNARAGTMTDDDDPRTIGRYGIGPCNARGQWLKNWASTQDLVMTNTFFQKQRCNYHTYVGPNGIPREIDYILTTKGFWKTVHDSEASNCIDLGSDHRSVRLRSAITRPTPQLQRQQKRPKTTKRTKNDKTTWPPHGLTTYQSTLANALDNERTTNDLDLKCKQIEQAIQLSTTLQATTNTSIQRVLDNSSDNYNNHHLTQLINQRWTTTNSTHERALISKKIRKEIRAIRRAERRAKIDHILEQCKDLKRISGIKSSKQKELITSMTRDDGQLKHNRRGIADIFADYYETLYARAHEPADTTTTTATNHNHTTPIDQFTLQELDTALKQLKNKKAPDKSGIIAEMLKNGGEALKHALLELYNEIIKPNATPPQQWKRTQITVIYKSGDARQPQNYRPISTIPLLYKLFARLLYNRIALTLDAQQPPDQAGFRHHFCTDDHLFTLAMIEEVAREWQVPVYLATLDFKKAFDAVSHQALWNALTDQGLAPQYVALLTQLYTNQTATVKTY